MAATAAARESRREAASPSAPCIRLSASASAAANAPSSAIMRAPRKLRVGSFAFPLAPLLQRFGDFARHVGLVVLGEDAFGLERLARNPGAFGDDALAFAEEIGKHAVIAHLDLHGAVGDAEPGGAVGIAPEGAFDDEAAEA